MLHNGRNSHDLFWTYSWNIAPDVTFSKAQDSRSRQRAWMLELNQARAESNSAVPQVDQINVGVANSAESNEPNGIANPGGPDQAVTRGVSPADFGLDQPDTRASSDLDSRQSLGSFSSGGTGGRRQNEGRPSSLMNHPSRTLPSENSTAKKKSKNRKSPKRISGHPPYLHAYENSIAYIDSEVHINGTTQTFTDSGSQLY